MSRNKLEITDVVVYPLKNQMKGSKLLALAKVVLNDSLIIHGIRVMQGPVNTFIVYPAGVPENIFHPTRAKLRSYIRDQVFAEYEFNKEFAIDASDMGTGKSHSHLKTNKKEIK